MMMDVIEKEMSRDRRAFIKNVLRGSIAGSLLLVIPAGAMDLADIPEQIPGMRKDTGTFISKRKFAFIVDITRCIGCGSCAYVCPTNTITIEEA